MIIGAHVILHTSQAEALRGVCRDVLQWEYVDAGDGWLIFASMVATALPAVDASIPVF